MPINREISGDLVEMAKENKFIAIVHGCNCFCKMGAGIAKQIKQSFPCAYEADCMSESGDKAKLGTYSTSKPRGCSFIVNAYTQFEYGRNKRHANYDAIRSVFKLINQNFIGASIGIPKIGAGLAGGDWSVIKSIIDEATPDIDITLVNFK